MMLPLVSGNWGSSSFGISVIFSISRWSLLIFIEYCEISIFLWGLIFVIVALTLVQKFITTAVFSVTCLIQHHPSYLINQCLQMWPLINVAPILKREVICTRLRPIRVKTGSPIDEREVKKNILFLNYVFQIHVSVH